MGRRRSAWRLWVCRDGLLGAAKKTGGIVGVVQTSLMLDAASMKNLFALVVALSIVLTTQVLDVLGVVHAAEREFVTEESLTEDLLSKNVDRIDRSLNNIKGQRYQGQILPLITDLWEQRKEKRPDLPWRLIGTDIIRVELADILMQAYKNGRVRIDHKPIHDYLSGLVNHEDFDVQRNAIGALSVIDDERDVDKILAVAKRQEIFTFPISVITLTMMCNAKAAMAIKELDATVKEPNLLAILSKQKAQSDDFKARTTRCERTTADIKK